MMSSSCDHVEKHWQTEEVAAPHLAVGSALSWVGNELERVDQTEGMLGVEGPGFEEAVATGWEQSDLGGGDGCCPELSTT